MFENIIGNNIVVKRLSSEIQNENLPSSILFSGPKFSGKLSLSLELARVLSCKEGAKWNCSCTSCLEHRFLQNPNLLCLGDGEFLSEIYAASQTFKMNSDKASMFLFVRAIRKLLLRFSPVLWETQSAKLSKNLSKFEKIDELLDTLKEDASSQEKEKVVDKIIKVAVDLESSLPNSGISVDQVRSVKNWLYTSNSNNVRVVIFENADTMNSSVRNALLKVLEEPPHNTYLILLTSNKSAIMPTILSRVRSYSLPPRDLSQSTQIISKIFRSQEYSQISLDDFFLINLGLRGDNILGDAKEFLNTVLASHRDSFLYPSEIVAKYSDQNLFLPFMNKLLLAIAGLIRDEDDGGFVFLADKWTKLINTSVLLVNTYNVNLKNTLEKLFFDMKNR
ncbi:MAG: hypothetical protein JXR63_12440 [Spirochaetales bacterium]|nr:hypothetical protein [Spirochaetales bacterium]